MFKKVAGLPQLSLPQQEPVNVFQVPEPIQRGEIEIFPKSQGLYRGREFGIFSSPYRGP